MAFKGTVNYIDRFARVKSIDSPYTSTTTAVDSSLNVELPKGVYQVEAFLPMTTGPIVSGVSSGVKLEFTFDGAYTNNKSFLVIQSAFAAINNNHLPLTSNTGVTPILDCNGTGMTAGFFSTMKIFGVIAVTVKGTAGFKFANYEASTTSTYYKGGWVKYTQLA